MIRVRIPVICSCGIFQLNFIKTVKMQRFVEEFDDGSKSLLSFVAFGDFDQFALQGFHLTALNG
jgi:hypothetical protein